MYGIAMERQGRTDIWPEVNDVSNLTLLDKILRDGQRGFDWPCVNHSPWSTKCNLKLQESTVRHLDAICHAVGTIVIDSVSTVEKRKNPT